MSVLLLSLWCPSAEAGSELASRAELDALVGVNRVDEGFEGPVIPVGATLWTGSDPVKHVDSTTLYQGQGPGLVVDGIRIVSTNPDQTGQNAWLQWNGDQYFGMQTQSIYTDRQLQVDFLSPVTVFGVDLEDYPLFPITDVGRVQVYAADDVTLLHEALVTVADEPGTFFGYRHAAGIGRVVFGTAVGDTSLSPQIDDLVFSTIALPPEPTLGRVGSCPGPSTITFTGFQPGGTIRLVSAQNTGSVAVPAGPCAGTVSGLGAAGLTLRASPTADGSGEATFGVTLPAGVCGNAYIQALNEATCTFSNVFAL